MHHDMSRILLFNEDTKESQWHPPRAPKTQRASYYDDSTLGEGGSRGREFKDSTIGEKCMIHRVNRLSSQHKDRGNTRCPAGWMSPFPLANIASSPGLASIASSPGRHTTIANHEENFHKEDLQQEGAESPDMNGVGVDIDNGDNGQEKFWRELRNKSPVKRTVKQWQEHFDPDSSCNWYYNTETGERSSMAFQSSPLFSSPVSLF